MTGIDKIFFITQAQPQNEGGIQASDWLKSFFMPLFIIFFTQSVIYWYANNPISYSSISLFIYIVVFVSFFAICIALLVRQRDLIIRTYQRIKNNRPILLISVICFAFFIIAGCIGLLLLFPPFAITNPQDGSFVPQSITVYGNGAIPGNSVTVWVIDDRGALWQQGSNVPSQNGNWQVASVQIGRDAGDSMKQFSIYAQTLDKGGNIVNSNTIAVSRS